MLKSIIQHLLSHDSVNNNNNNDAIPPFLFVAVAAGRIIIYIC